MEEIWESVPLFPAFKELSLEDKPIFDIVFKTFPPVISELTFTNLFIWRHTYKLKFSRWSTFLCLLSDQTERPFFFPSVGTGNVLECSQVLLHYLKEKGAVPRIARVPEDIAVSLDWRGAGIEAQLDRDQSDYVYLTKDLIQLSGRKYHRKRNHIKQFAEKYSHHYVTLTPAWISECLRLQTEWCDLRNCEAIPGLASEFVAIKEVFTHFSQLGVTGGAILINDRVEAFTLGEPLNPETVVVHVEKANPAIDGLYTVINQAFLEKEWSGTTYVNREQDLGQEGLRKAKESYFPHHWVNKYSLTLL
jgi:uncharacterized protein